jgi:hypothetical protein
MPWFLLRVCTELLIENTLGLFNRWWGLKYGDKQNLAVCTEVHAVCTERSGGSYSKPIDTRRCTFTQRAWPDLQYQFGSGRMRGWEVATSVVWVCVAAVRSRVWVGSQPAPHSSDASDASDARNVDRTSQSVRRSLPKSENQGVCFCLSKPEPAPWPQRSRPAAVFALVSVSACAFACTFASACACLRSCARLHLCVCLHSRSCLRLRSSLCLRPPALLRSPAPVRLLALSLLPALAL